LFVYRISTLEIERREEGEGVVGGGKG